MSKSLGNFVTIRELLATQAFGGRQWPGEVLRLAMLRTHYRQPIDWTVRALEEAEATLERWYEAVGDAPTTAEPAAAVLDALADDLNTPAAIAELHKLSATSEDAARLKASADLLGLLPQTRSARLASNLREAGVEAGKVEALIGERKAARASRNWAESDRLRDVLAALGVAIKDNKDGTTSWEMKR